MQFDKLVQEFNDTVGCEDNNRCEGYGCDELEEKYARRTAWLSGCPIYFVHPDSAYRLDKIAPSLEEYFTGEELKYRPNFWKRYVIQHKWCRWPNPRAVSTIRRTGNVFCDTESANLSLEPGRLAKTAQMYYEWSGGQRFSAWITIMICRNYGCSWGEGVIRGKPVYSKRRRKSMGRLLHTS